MDVQGKKVTVVGLGQTAVALVRLLLREGARPFVTELKDPEAVAALRRELDALGVAHECGGHSEAAFENAACVIPSPGAPLSIKPLRLAREGGLPVLSEMELAHSYCRSRILAVTGTNGKTTTTELLRTLVSACSHSVLLAGNNAYPFSAAVMVEPPPEYIVLEVSSYQLEGAVQFRPWVGTVLNVTPDHLARHGTMTEYAAVKARIFAAQSVGDVAVVNADDPCVREMPIPGGAEVWRFSLYDPQPQGLWVDGEIIRDSEGSVASVTDTQLRGRHNLQNVLAALTVMRAGRFDWDRTLHALRAFEGVEHRIEPVAEIAGVRYYNDSKSTNIDSLKVALESFEEPVVLIAGGQGKGADYRVLRGHVRERVKALVTLGQDAPLLEAAFGDLVPTFRAMDMDDAVGRAAAVAARGEVVLLSPACASFDMYRDFEHRGQVFKESVRAYERRLLHYAT